MPDRSNDDAVEAWFKMMDTAIAEMDAASERELEACERLFEEIADLAGVDPGEAQTS